MPGELAYNCVIESPWGPYEKFDVKDPKEVARLLYEVDVKIAEKQTCFKVYEHLLHELHAMPVVLEQCGNWMNEYKELKEAGNGWMIAARSQRTQKLKDVSRRLDSLQEMMLKARESLDTSLTYYGEGVRGHMHEDSDAEVIEVEEKALDVPVEPPRLRGGRGEEA
jgi:hypothetical protein